MANILDKYGIKEVCDITFYNIDDNGKPSFPVLYIDTAKVSTLEQAAESVDATGGKGNVPLITWDYGRDITMTLEDALFSAKSLGVMFGADPQSPTGKLAKTLAFTCDTNDGNKGIPTYWEGPDGVRRSLVTKDTSGNITDFNGLIYAADVKDADDYSTNGASKSTRQVAYNNLKDGHAYFFKFYVDIIDTMTIDITSSNFPGTYYVTGDTYARSEKTGKDEFFQLIIPKAKVLSEDVSLTMEAEGDPSTFQMNLKVLRNQEANQKGMVQLIKYGVEEGESEGYTASIWSLNPEDKDKDTDKTAS